MGSGLESRPKQIVFLLIAAAATLDALEAPLMKWSALYVMTDGAVVGRSGFLLSSGHDPGTSYGVASGTGLTPNDNKWACRALVARPEPVHTGGALWGRPCTGPPVGPGALWSVKAVGLQAECVVCEVWAQGLYDVGCVVPCV